MKLKKYNRKSILKIFAWSAAGITSIVFLKNRSFFDHLIPQKKKRLAMIMDLDKCIGCNACTVACKAENGVPLGGFRTRVLEEEINEYPNTERYFLPMMCNHCVDAPCIPACLNKAFSEREDGLVAINKDKCKGFQLCILACPYGAIYIDTNIFYETKDHPSIKVNRSDKCNFCQHRIDEGLEPACSNTCPTDARIFGDLEDLNSKVFKIVNSEKLTGLLEDEGTKPQVFYKGGKKEIFEIKKSINNFKS